MVVRMRHTRAHSGNRRSHHALKEAGRMLCENCGASRRSHHMCLSCGFYNGRQVLDLGAENASRSTRVAATKTARAEAAQADAEEHDHADHAGHDHA